MNAVAVSLNGEHLFAGEQMHVPFQFWHGVKVADIYDWEAVVARLEAIRTERGYHFDLRPDTRTIAVPPIFTVERDDSLTLASEPIRNSSTGRQS